MESFLMTCHRVQEEQNKAQSRRRKSAQGFTLIELMFVCLIAMIMSAMAIPLVQNGLVSFRIHGAASAVTGSLQATRYQAIFNGYPFRIVYSSTALTYQVQNDVNRTGTFANYCPSGGTTCTVPLAGSGLPLTLDADTTFTFSPGGTVTSTTAASGVTTMVLTYLTKTETITVSSYGNIKVTP
jgi:Tfp pilus assembly protein FimT